jgi:nucleotide-binding universal stress UspA family protein
MNSSMPTTGDLYLVVGYDGSDPADRALDTAAALLRGRDGCIDVVYVPHMPSVDMLTPEAVAGMTVTFDELTRDLHAQASEQLRGREEERWRFERGQDMYSDVPGVLIGVAEKVRTAHPADNVAIVVGSSSQARHRVVGSVAVSLARQAPVPLLIVP